MGLMVGEGWICGTAKPLTSCWYMELLRERTESWVGFAKISGCLYELVGTG